MILPDIIKDAFIDSINLVPFLFVIFILIEIFENYFSHKLSHINKYSEKIGPIIGAFFAAIPQCGFSVVAAMLYVKKLISKGTLIAVFISTSDEAVPILLANPHMIHTIIPLISIKIGIAIFAGYVVDFIFKPEIKSNQEIELEDEGEEGCCKHKIPEKNRLSTIFHPIKHTLNIFVFIFITTLALSFFINHVGEENIGKILAINSPIQPIIAAFVGLIPNCAISVLITLLFIKNAISFGSTIAGLCSSAGLGLLVLIKKNSNLKDTISIVIILITISIISGLALQTFH